MLSVAGGVTLLAYAIHLRDPVFIVGQVGGLFVYSRNLWLIYGLASRRDETGGRDSAPGPPG